MTVLANSYRVWFTIDGECDYTDLTAENEKAAREKFYNYFPNAVIDEIYVTRENVRCW